MTNTKNMSKQEKEKLQEKLDAMLCDTIQKVRDLGYDTYPTDEKVRITNNKRTLGSATVINGALLSVYSSHKTYHRRSIDASTREIWDATPKFRISISTQECGCDEDILNILFHEVIHTIPNCLNHGYHFKEAAKKVNNTYGVNVETRKKVDTQTKEYIDSVARDKKIMSELKKHIGELVDIKNRTFIFRGFNGRPKNCCDLYDCDNGGNYVCCAYSVAKGFGIEV